MQDGIKFKKKKRTSKHSQSEKFETQSEKLLLSNESPFAVREAYKVIRTNLVFSVPDEKCRKLLITSAVQHEGKSITAINLAIAFAESGASVLLVDCDLRLPTVAQKLNITQEEGLTNVLAGMNSIDEVVCYLDNGVDVITSGNIPPNPSELLGSAQMEGLISELESRYQYIIFDAPPVEMVTDAVVLSRLASGVVMVSQRETSTIESISSSLRQLRMADAKILGFIFTRALNEKQKSYKKYGYGYGH